VSQANMLLIMFIALLVQQDLIHLLEKIITVFIVQQEHFLKQVIQHVIHALLAHILLKALLNVFHAKPVPITI
jgi:hypothetical protein